MSEGIYRICIVALLAVLVFGSLRIGSQMADNGRFIQYDAQKDFVVWQGVKEGSGAQVIDTRTGQTVFLNDLMKDSAKQ